MSRQLLQSSRKRAEQHTEAEETCAKSHGLLPQRPPGAWLRADGKRDMAEQARPLRSTTCAPAWRRGPAGCLYPRRCFPARRPRLAADMAVGVAQARVRDRLGRLPVRSLPGARGRRASGGALAGGQHCAIRHRPSPDLCHRLLLRRLLGGHAPHRTRATAPPLGPPAESAVRVGDDAGGCRRQGVRPERGGAARHKHLCRVHLARVPPLRVRRAGSRRLPRGFVAQ
mmetsp:Transcript_8081/g.23935  ORF Transcript_8081/g.23935 Transcript_8081/m.23935 type:complete len:227 (+) Transcript_8081:119-799(+)